MPALENPKEEALAQTFVTDPKTRFNQTQTYLKVIPTVTPSSAEVLGAREFGKVRVKNRIQEILDEKLGLTDDYLLNFGKEKFLHNDDPNIGLKAWRTFLEIKGVIGGENQVNVAQIVFNEQIVRPNDPTSDNPPTIMSTTTQTEPNVL